MLNLKTCKKSEMVSKPVQSAKPVQVAKPIGTHFIKLSQDLDGKYNGMYPADFNEYLLTLPVPFYLQRDCNSCADTHKKIIYKRLTSLSNLKSNQKGLFTLIHEDWDPDLTGNKSNIDFKLYSSMSDAINNVNEWKYYDPRDPASNVGFPRDASPNTGVPMQWQSLSKEGGMQNWSWSLYVDGVGNNCNNGSCNKPS